MVTIDVKAVELREAQEQLKKTGIKLSETQMALRRTYVRMNEEKLLLEEHHKAEAALLECGEEMQGELNKLTSEAGALHDKIGNIS